MGIDNYNALPWYKKLFYPGALSAALRQYGEDLSSESAFTVRNACLKKTWFFQRWLFPSLVSFSSSGFVTPMLAEVLPAEILLTIGETLSFKEKARLASTSKYYHGLFQPELRAAKLLLLVVQGQQDEAHSMLGQHPDLLLKPGDIKDYSGRTFKKITAYEYAYWAKDTHMCRMLERHMDDETKAEILARIKVIEGIDTAPGQPVGLEYLQGGLEHRSAHFDLLPLISALQRYVDGYDNWERTHNWDAMRAAWMEVGILQRDMPVHVVNEYCRPDRSFHPRPEFNEGALPRSLRFYSFETAGEQSLFPLVISDSSGLGIDFALVRADQGAAGARWLMPPGRGLARRGAAVAIDLAAISHLDEIRTVDLTRLRESLLPTDLEPSHSMRV